MRTSGCFDCPPCRGSFSDHPPRPPREASHRPAWLPLLLGGLALACSSPAKQPATESSGGATGSGGTTSIATGGASGTGGHAGTGAGGTTSVETGGTTGTGRGGTTGTDEPDARTPTHDDAGVMDAALADTGVPRPDTGVPADTGSGGSTGTGYLHVSGNQLLDSQNRSVRLTGVNWFGFETSNQAPHGTWARDYKSMLKQIHDLGFNTVRVPFSNAIQRPNAAARSVNTSGKDPYDGTDPMNADLEGKSPMDMLDLVVKAAGEVGLRLILDNHSRDPDGYMNEKVWYTASTPEDKWIEDWVTMVKRYKGNPTVVAVDLDNEPHGKPTDNPKGASWGTGDPSTDWNTAAEKCGNAILEANPDVLIVVEGVEVVGSEGYWWGGNLTGVTKAPIKLSRPEKLMYSAHEYGPEVHNQPWFTDAKFPSNLASVWNTHFDFIMQKGLGHILLGEFGIRDRASYGGTEGAWFDTLMSTLGPTYSWTYWCWNPNSGDTGGILSDDWVTPVQWKMDALKPYLAPMLDK